MTESHTRLPAELAHIVTKPLIRFLQIEAVAGIALLFSTIIALLLSNTAWSVQFLDFWDMDVGVVLGGVEYSRSLRHWINDGLMTVFFFVVTLELKRAMVLGELRNPRAAALPFAAALGGMVAPAGLFLLLMGGARGANGWGTVMSTDTAFVIGCLALLGSRIPISLRLFLLSLAIFDDIGAILVVAIGYGGPLNWPALGVAAIGLGFVAGIGRLGVRSFPVYFAMGGLVWLALDASGIHATLAGVILGLMTPARSWVSDRRLHAILNRVIARPSDEHWDENISARYDLNQAGVAAREALSPIERLLFSLHPWVAFIILPLFALANAGVPIAKAHFDPTLTSAIILAFVVAKPLGIITFSFLVVRLRIGTLPSDLSWRLLSAGSLLAGIGFTMALFIAELAFPPDLLGSVKLGIMAASVISALAGFLSLVWVTRDPRRT